MSRSRRDFIQLVGLNGLAAAACARASLARAQSVAPVAPPLGAPGTRSSVLRLSSNENSAGPGEQVLAAMQDSFGAVNRYAFRSAGELADALAAHLSVSTGNIATGCGSSDILDAAGQAFLASDRALVTALPTFELLTDRASRLGAPVVEVPVDDQLRLDLTRMAGRAAGAGLVYICNPNNPTGTVHGAADIEQAVHAVLRTEPRATVLIDEAYHEYVEHPAYRSAVPLALDNPRVVVARTFSKVYGMAGLRVGYAVGHHQALSAMSPYLSGFRHSILSMNAALAALDGQDRVAAGRRQNHEARALTTTAFRQAGYRVVDSEANFVMVDVRRDIRAFQQACRSRGVEIARPFPPLLTWARITIGTMDEMRHAWGVFKEALGDPAPSALDLTPPAPYVPRRDGTWAC